MFGNSEVQFGKDLLGGVQKVTSSLYSDSFDSGYSASPVGHALGVSPTRQQISGRKPGQSANMDDNGFFITSPNKYNLNANMFSVSPLKTEPVTFSPFKDSSLSPFKLINQSPSKGSFDDWDKDFIASFEENLFGIGDLSENTVEELLKSPKGKALLERGRNSQGLGGSPAGKYIKISPLRRPVGQGNLFTEDDGVTLAIKREPRETLVKQEPTETFVVKRENVENDHMYGQTYVYVNSNGTLSAIDPDKMSATPIKPRATHVENAPKRKLAMKTSAASNPVQAIIFQSEQTPQIAQNNQQPVWPSKERLNFARSHFRKVLNSAVEKERLILQELQTKNGRNKNKRSQAQPALPEKSSKATKAAGGKTKKSGGGKGKGKLKKGTKKDRYPEISMALSKPFTSGKRSRTSHSRQFTDFPTELEVGIYLDNADDDEDQGWTGRPPFYSQMSTGFDTYSDVDTSDEEWTTGYRYHTVAGNRVPHKKRRR